MPPRKRKGSSAKPLVGNNTKNNSTDTVSSQSESNRKDNNVTSPEHKKVTKKSKSRNGWAKRLNFFTTKKFIFSELIDEICI